MRDNDYTLLIDTVDEPETQGIFTFLKNNATPEVPEYLQNDSVLNLDYYYRHSGYKCASPLTEHFLSDGKLNAAASGKLALIILNACKSNWDKVYNALTIDYSPIENVDETLTETTDRTGNVKSTSSNTHSGTDNHVYKGDDSTSHTGTDTAAQSGTDTTTNTGTTTTAQGGTDTITNTGTVTDAQTGTDTTTNTGTQENKNVNKDGTSETINGLAGFNSDEYNKDNKSTTTVNQTITDTRTDNLKSALEHGLTDTRTDDTTNTTNYGRTDTQTDNTTQAIQHGLTDTRTLDTKDSRVYTNSDDETIDITDNGTGSQDSTGNEKHDLRRHGNVGVTTNQYMITEELKLRQQLFIDEMFRDVDKFLALAVY